ncbi:Putative thioredoxin superfamily protein [Zea mays]|uniref:Putative thioredoxin superfamily protein n=1 Tax=Zea mays TaxID=4577 RepID=A0A1D6J2L9_MAIZE|nr:Putative thioredoxin superfamily protein [Zea mays]
MHWWDNPWLQMQHNQLELPWVEYDSFPKNWCQSSTVSRADFWQEVQQCPWGSRLSHSVSRAPSAFLSYSLVYSSCGGQTHSGSFVYQEKPVVTR